MSYVTKVDLVGVGLNATDTVIPLPEYPVRGSKVEYRHATVLLAVRSLQPSSHASAGESAHVT